MTRVAAATCAVGLVLGCGLRAQEAQQSAATLTVNDTKTMSYTGCIRAGTETQAFVIDRITPMAQTIGGGADGTITLTAAGYTLVLDEKVELPQHVGRKVEIIGTLVPPGESGSAATHVNAQQQLRVSAIKELSESCE